MLHGYATQRVDGHLYVFDVPIFAECTIDGTPFDAAWIEDAFRNTHTRNASGYWPPMHVRHHGEDRAHEGGVSAAGDFFVTRTGPLPLEDETGAWRDVHAVFATLRFKEPSAIYRAENEELPYRSIEITPADLEKRCLSTVALLDHEPPWLKFPNLRLQLEGTSSSSPAEIQNAKIEDAQGLTMRELLVGSASPSADGRRCLAFAFSERQAMPKVTRNTSQAAPKGTARAADPKDDEQQTAAAEAAASFDAMLEAISSKSITVEQMERLLEALNSAMQSDGGTGSGTGDGEGEVPPQGQAAEDDEEKKRSLAGVAASARRAGNPKAGAASSRELAAAEARATAAEIRAEVVETATARSKAVDAALLRFRGKPMGARLRERLEAGYDRVGANGFPDYLDDLAAMQLGAGARASEANPQPFRTAEVPDEALAYSALGNAAVDRALVKCAEWKQLSEKNLTRRPQSAYVRSAMAREGFRLPDPASAK